MGLPLLLKPCNARLFCLVTFYNLAFFFEVTMYTREFYSSFDDLFERFAIMTVDGNLSDENAILYLQAHTTIELYKKLKKTVAVLYKKKEKL